MLEKLSGIEQRYDDLSKELLEVGGNYQRAAEINKERVDLEPIVGKAREYRQAMKSLEEARTILTSEGDAELKALAETELTDLTPKIETLDKEIRGLLVPKDARDEKNVIVEVRAGTGATRPPYLRRICSACIRVTPKANAGKARSCRRIPSASADTRK